jgi:hypothetical protein
MTKGEARTQVILISENDFSLRHRDWFWLKEFCSAVCCNSWLTIMLLHHRQVTCSIKHCGLYVAALSVLSFAE